MYLCVEATRLGENGNSVRVELELTGLLLDSTSLRYAGSGADRVSGVVRGSGFDAKTEFELRPSGQGPTVPATETVVLSEGRAEVSFDLLGVRPGVYDLLATEPEDEAVLPRAFRVLFCPST